MREMIFRYIIIIQSSFTVALNHRMDWFTFIYIDAFLSKVVYHVPHNQQAGFNVGLDRVFFPGYQHTNQI